MAVEVNDVALWSVGDDDVLFYI